jgi:glycosyltransferase involved in cell wall biosynthesis
MKATLFQLSFELGVSQAVVWLGPVEHSKLVEEGYYFLGDLFVTMSRFETQGLSTAEAMACGLPVIGAKAHATPEVVGEAGLVFTTQDPKRIALKVEELLNDPQKILQLEKHALYNASQLTVQACSQKLLSIYQGLIDSYQKKSND